MFLNSWWNILSTKTTLIGRNRGACLLIVDQICHYFSIENDKMDRKLRGKLESMKQLLESPTPKVPKLSRSSRRRNTQRDNQTPNVSTAAGDENAKDNMKDVNKTIDLMKELLESGGKDGNTIDSGSKEGGTIVNGKKMEGAKVSVEEAGVNTVPSVGDAHGIEESPVG
jgi:hypothetical protein